MTSPLRDEPQQWVRVPVEPTPEMLDKAGEVDGQSDKVSRAIYRALISAAPKDSKHIERAMELAEDLAHALVSFNCERGQSAAGVKAARMTLRRYLEGGQS